MVDNAPRVLAGRYEVGDLIGRGGMAEVHIGHDTRLGRTVAIKILRSDLARDPSFLARFRREAQAAAALNHPAIVAVYDTGEDVHTDTQGASVHVPFIVMEYVEGHTVRDILRDGQAVPIDEAVEISAGVLAALEYSHHAGIVHRDIKPANVMITPTGAVKVMDFGIARAVADSAATMTQTQAVIGTAQYLSPEQARGETVDARSDLYSTGCLLFELLTGRPPFIGDSPVAVAYQHVREAPAKPSAIAPDVPEVLDRITLKALAKDRNARYSSAAEFRADLENAVRGGTITAPALGVAAAAAGLGAAAAADLQPTMVESATQVMSPTAPPSPWATAAAPAVPPGEEPPGEDEEEGKSRKGLMWALIAVGVLAIAAIVTMLLLNREPPAPDTVEVPTVQEGMTQSEAAALFEGLDLEFTPLLEENADIPEDEFVRQEPAGGEDVAPGTEVSVWFSTGPDSVQVPDVSGLTQDEARAELEEAGLTVGNVSTEESASVPEGAVTRTEPAANETAASGQAVTLFTSNGLVSLGELVGMTRDEAEAALDDLGLDASVNEVESDEEAGRVIAQRPNPGKVAQGSTVEIDVAIEPAAEMTSVPGNLAGMTEQQAIETLNANALNPGERITQESQQWAAGIVIGSDPGAGTQLEEGSTVRLIVSTGPGPGGGGENGGGENGGGENGGGENGGGGGDG
ncbi:Stk1 family PASTA domain-containing Ser/Thr kinase [Cellulosimicrobium marinum]|uniref:Stk1 family PASTA domain-containing Ser/Thr kinase n=1 Tax=Cellulosimicrobium marinum TaxID=1638992 RepID=UPI001E361532|nr:Stk1 family PASTA domain-containing Ser/Thr kinase [Cellulosimicrobium marinum]MCB7135748.1 Stk1 family PASTA domain-containing Ser/Thr kinase [Cellulosimicrobium marinum]